MVFYVLCYISIWGIKPYVGLLRVLVFDLFKFVKFFKFVIVKKIVVTLLILKELSKQN